MVLTIQKGNDGCLYVVTAIKDVDDDKQVWDASELADGGWGFIHNKGNGLVMDVQHGLGNKGANVITLPKRNEKNSNQLWKYEDGFIISQQTGLALDISGEKRNAGTNLIVWGKKAPSRTRNQKWTFLQQQMTIEGKVIDVSYIKVWVKIKILYILLNCRF